MSRPLLPSRLECLRSAARVLPSCHPPSQPEHPILKSVSALAKIETSTEASPAAEEAASNAENTNPDTADPEGNLVEAVAEHNMLVFDFGGGTLDVTIMKISGMSSRADVSS